MKTLIVSFLLLPYAGYTQITAFEYDRSGRLMKATYPNQTSENYSYDQDGNRISKQIGAGVPLVNNLQSFVAESDKCVVNIYWNINTPQLFDYFELERSKDGSSFVSLFKAIANEEKKYYSFTDEHPILKQFNHYRLKLVNKDGNILYSKTCSAYSNCNVSGLFSVFPNPAIETINIIGQGLKGRIYDIDIINELGQILKSYSFPANNNSISQQISVSTLSPGVYYIRIKGEEKTETYKITKL